MLNRTAPNPRAVIGNNLPPTSAIELAEPTIEALRAFLTDNPVIGNEDEAREAKAILDRAIAALKGIDDERKSKVDPLNAQVKEVNTSYHKWHNASGKSGTWDKLLAELRSRMTAFAREEERRRQATAEAARARAEEEARKAREAADALQRAQEDACTGVCEDIGGAIEQAEATAAAAIKAGWTAQRAEHQTKVRLTGGFAKAASLRTIETLTVADWRAAIAEMSGANGEIPQNIADAILTSARNYRRMFDALPSGITATHERSL